MAQTGIFREKNNFRELCFMNKRNFTLVELLVVVGIIAILAGLLTPAVIGAQQQGRITQARSDMATILMALKGLDGTYGKMVTSDYKMGKSSVTGMIKFWYSINYHTM